jgi:glycerol kinase
VKKYILSIDQGTTGTTVIIFDKNSKEISRSYQEFKQYYPKPGWVEHNPEEIWNTVVEGVKIAVNKGKISPDEIAGIGITNQRETTILWRKSDGKPYYNAIVWQCRRTAQICDELKKKGYLKEIKNRTGLVIDAYFSGTKIKWLLDNVKNLRREASKGNVLFGTVDTYLVYNLTGGEVHITDYSNASRTMLYNINKLTWDRDILKELNIPENILPDVKPSSYIYGYTKNFPSLPDGIPISAVVGDQQSALFGQACFKEGMAKNTYGTGCFVLLNTGEKIIKSKKGLLTTIAWGLNNKVEYALEGSVFIAGAVVQWLRDELKIINSADETEDYIKEVKDNAGVYFVPAFVGLGAPYWDMYARGAIFGLTRGTKRAHIIRAAIEAIAYQSKDVISTMLDEAKIDLKELRVDGGATANNFLMQFQADILGVPVIRPKIRETTALGAAYLAGLAVGIFNNKEEISKNWQIDKKFLPKMRNEEREKLYFSWKKAVERAKKWEI